MLQPSRALLSQAETFCEAFSSLDLSFRAELLKRSGELLYGIGILLLICVIIKWPQSIQSLDLLEFYFSLPRETVDILGRYGFPPTMEAAKDSVLAAFTASRVVFCLLAASIVAIGAKLRRRNTFCHVVLLAFVAVPAMDLYYLKISLIFFSFLMLGFLIISAIHGEWKALLKTALFVFLVSPLLLFVVVPSPPPPSAHVPNMKWFFNVASTYNTKEKSRKIAYTKQLIAKKIPAATLPIVLPSLEKLLLTNPIPDHPNSIVPTWWRFADSPFSVGFIMLASGVGSILVILFGLLLEIVGHFMRKRVIRLDGLMAQLNRLRAPS